MENMVLQYWNVSKILKKKILKKFNSEVLFFSVSYGRKKYWSIQFFQYYQNFRKFWIFSIFEYWKKNFRILEIVNTSVFFFRMIMKKKILQYQIFSVSYRVQKYWNIFILSTESILRFYFYQYLKILKNFKSSIYQ